MYKSNLFVNCRASLLILKMSLVVFFLWNVISSCQFLKPNKKLSESNSFSLTGLRSDKEWVDIMDIEKFSNLMEYNGVKDKYTQRYDYVGFKGYSYQIPETEMKDLNNKELQSMTTSMLEYDIFEFWAKGHEYRVKDKLIYKIDPYFKGTKIHYFPVLSDLDKYGTHWSTIIVDTESKTVEYYDSLNKTPPEFVEERLERIKTVFSTLNNTDFSIERNLILKSPHQLDGINCGVFSMWYAELRAQNFSRNEAFDFIETMLEVDHDEVILQQRKELSAKVYPGNNDLDYSKLKEIPGLKGFTEAEKNKSTIVWESTKPGNIDQAKSYAKMESRRFSCGSIDCFDITYEDKISAKNNREVSDLIDRANEEIKKDPDFDIEKIAKKNPTLLVSLKNKLNQTNNFYYKYRPNVDLKNTLLKYRQYTRNLSGSMNYIKKIKAPIGLIILGITLINNADN